MTDTLAQICQAVRRRVRDGTYDARPRSGIPSTPSLAAAVGDGRAIVAEIKRRAPSWSSAKPVDDVRKRAETYRTAGAAGISVLTERDRFDGSLVDLAAAAQTGAPTLMKDFVLDPAQVDAAAAHGASAVLLIQAVFDDDHADVPRDALVDVAHDHGLDVVVEGSTADEFDRARGSDADIVAVNARRLDDLDVSLDRAVTILGERDVDRPAMIFSGITDGEDVCQAFDAGADGELVGTTLMEAEDPAEVIRRWLA